MFTTFAATDTHVAVQIDNDPLTWVTQAEYRQLGADMDEWVPEVLTTQFVDGTVVPLRAKAAKCHNFEGGWNGFEFYTDSKGVFYAIVRPYRPFHISIERMLSE